MKALTKKELLESLAREQSHNQALRMLVMHLPYEYGYHFVRSLRSDAAFLLFVDETGHVDIYDDAKPRAEIEARNAFLWRMNSDDNDVRTLSTLQAAIIEEAKYLRETGR